MWYIFVERVRGDPLSDVCIRREEEKEYLPAWSIFVMFWSENESNFTLLFAGLAQLQKAVQFIIQNLVKETEHFLAAEKIMIQESDSGVLVQVQSLHSSVACSAHNGAGQDWISFNPNYQLKTGTTWKVYNKETRASYLLQTGPLSLVDSDAG